MLIVTFKALELPLFSRIGLSNTVILYIRLGQTGVNFGDSLPASGVCYMGSKDEDVVKYFGKKNIVFTYAQLDLKFMY